MSTHLAELIFPSTSVIVPTPSLQIHPKTLDTQAQPLRRPYSPKHCVFHLGIKATSGCIKKNRNQKDHWI
jgi:hypothetical protein